MLYVHFERKWISTPMEMEKSLNSSRNFKLPPIQGAVPAASILRQPPRPTWQQDQARANAVALPNHGASVKPRAVIHIPKDPFPGRYRSPHISHNISSVSTQRLASNAAIDEKYGDSKLDFAPRRHQLPQSYSVLPPIQKLKEPVDRGRQVTAAQDRTSRGEKENNNLNVTNKPIGDNSSQSDNQKSNDPRKVGNSNGKNGDKNCSRVEAGKDSSSRKKQKTDNQDNETGERKQSPTTLLFLKGKRKGRRVGVCVENEPALINITEQLKEIFLRRNMEEMYLI